MSELHLATGALCRQPTSDHGVSLLTGGVRRHLDARLPALGYVPCVCDGSKI